MGPAGIEPAPLVLQTSVRTSYTKDPYTLRWYLPFLKSTLSPCLFYLSVLPYWVPEANTLWDRRESNPLARVLQTRPIPYLPIPILKLSRREPIFCFLLDSYSLLTMVQSVTVREPNLIFVPRDGYAPPPFACKTNTLLLRQRGWQEV